MIRRTPTLIPMNDTDVQAIRNLLAQKKAETAQAVGSKGKAKDATESNKPFVAAEEAKKQREAMSKDERLGIVS
ncbi:hypothetical protein K488DRAFT_58203 [Vararia minispora EC-137]|uniref:Uncharacterized protein n=1 Tax=Vararia minispora EC-137 TaxID=1314806 RepID=A0ACB8Q9U5_9AGAM|nr:hypothetical protein K488DRAFT_58203 [Vararia minispora EC-137]